MRFKGIIWVGGFSTVFLLLPSMAIKLWEAFKLMPWQYKSWLFYFITALVLVLVARHNLKRRKAINKPETDDNLLLLAKKRLAQGEITLEEYRQIKEELV